MRLIVFLFSITLTLLPVIGQDELPKVILWEINSLDSIGGFPVTIYGDPLVIETEDGNAIEFDGIDDGLLIESNPLASATEFTVEVIFKPYPGGPDEQRFVHFQQDDDNRALIELRLTPEDNWFLDTFIKSGSSSCALYSDSYYHETSKWWHACLVYKDNVMTHYVNGVKELSDSVAFREVNSGKTSLGVRQNLVSWYKGAIKTLKVTHKALSPEDFMISDTTTDSTTVDLDAFTYNSKSVNIFPNPVKSAASISYLVTENSKVRIVIYNSKLEQICELVNTLQATGTYSIPFKRKELPAGIYFCLVRCGDNISAKKFLVVD